MDKLSLNGKYASQIASGRNNQCLHNKSIDNNKAGLIGYSMGGYGAVNTIGGCYNFTEATSSAITGIKDPEQVKKMITHTKREMERMAKSLNFIEASRLRDELHFLEENLQDLLY